MVVASRPIPLSRTESTEHVSRSRAGRDRVYDLLRVVGQSPSDAATGLALDGAPESIAVLVASGDVGRADGPDGETDNRRGLAGSHGGIESILQQLPHHDPGLQVVEAGYSGWREARPGRGGSKTGASDTASWRLFPPRLFARLLKPAAPPYQPAGRSTPGTPRARRRPW